MGDAFRLQPEGVSLMTPLDFGVLAVEKKKKEGTAGYHKGGNLCWMLALTLQPLAPDYYSVFSRKDAKPPAEERTSRPS